MCLFWCILIKVLFFFKSRKPLAATHSVVKWGTCVHQVCCYMSFFTACLQFAGPDHFCAPGSLTLLLCIFVMIVITFFISALFLTNWSEREFLLSELCDVLPHCADWALHLSRRAAWMWRQWSRHTGGTPSWDIPSIHCTPPFYLCPMEMSASTVSAAPCCSWWHMHFFQCCSLVMLSISLNQSSQTDFVFCKCYHSHSKGFKLEDE